jgi:hypothetical protein
LRLFLTLIIGSFCCDGKLKADSEELDGDEAEDFMDGWVTLVSGLSHLAITFMRALVELELS